MNTLRLGLVFAIVACCIVSVDCKPTDYYKVLGLRRDASEKQIKSAYRRLALKYHPDKIKGSSKEAAQKQFIKISQAYEVLGDPNKKRAFDEDGIDPNDPDQQEGDGEEEGFGFPFGDGFGGEGFEFFAGDGGFPNVMFFEDDSWGDTEMENPNPFENSDVIDLKWDALPPSGVWVVMFYSPNEDSEEIAEPYRLFATAISAYHIQVGAIDCGMAEEFCLSQGFDLEEGGVRVRIYPMVRLRNKPVRQQQRGTSKPFSSEEFSKRELFKWAIEYAPSFVTIVHGASFDNFVRADEEMYKVILFSDKEDVPGIFKALSVEFEGKLSFGKVSNMERSLMEIYHVHEVPHLIVQRSASSDPVAYHGKMARDTIHEFLLRYALPEAVPIQAGTCQAGQSCDARPQRTQSRPVHQLRLDGIDSSIGTATFGSVCSQDSPSAPICVIALLSAQQADRDHIRRLEQLAQENHEYQFVWLNEAQISTFISGFGIDERPSLLVYKPKRMRWAGFFQAWCCDEAATAELRAFFDRIRLGDLPMSRLAQSPKL